MLAEVPRAVERRLREAGIPVEPLSDVPLLAAGTGRFVVFDSRNPHSAARARQAAVHGLKIIDLRELLPASDDLPQLLEEDDDSGWQLAAESAPVNVLLDRLKKAIELLGGVWLRIADYPFPYQSAICLGIEHLSEELADFAAIAATLPGKATHFVSSRLRADRLAFLSQAGATDLGWQIRHDDYKSLPRRTLAHWTTRQGRFAAGGLQPGGLALGRDAGPAPETSRLLTLGLRYSCLEAPGVACRAETHLRADDQTPWIRFSTVVLPPRDRILEWVAAHYQSGCPLFLTASTARLDLVQELLRLAGDAGRCSLMWQTSFGEFSRWWASRQQLRLQVWHSETGYEIHATGETVRYPWAVEIWRGNHVATVPLRNSTQTIPDEGLVYSQSLKRNPAGCTMPGDDVRSLVAKPGPR